MNLETAFIGYCMTRAEADVHAKAIEFCGVPCRVRRNGRASYGPSYGYHTYTLWVPPDCEQQARDIRKGFKVGLALLGDPYNVALGVRAAMILREGKKNGIPSHTPKAHRRRMAFHESRVLQRLQTGHRMVDRSGQNAASARSHHSAIAAHAFRELPERGGVSREAESAKRRGEARRIVSMNVRDAYETLRPPLRFGDERQIAARKFLEKVELAKEAIEKCDANHWDSVLYDNGEGGGTKARWIAACECVEEFEKEVREQAAVVLVDRWRPQ